MERSRLARGARDESAVGSLASAPVAYPPIPGEPPCTSPCTSLPTAPPCTRPFRDTSHMRRCLTHPRRADSRVAAPAAWESLSRQGQVTNNPLAEGAGQSRGSWMAESYLQSMSRQQGGALSHQYPPGTMPSYLTVETVREAVRGEGGTNLGAVGRALGWLQGERECRGNEKGRTRAGEGCETGGLL
jgi:hypothetical protein